MSAHVHSGLQSPGGEAISIQVQKTRVACLSTCAHAVSDEIQDWKEGGEHTQGGVGVGAVSSPHLIPWPVAQEGCRLV